MYEYACQVTKVHDGDTATVVIDVGFHLSFRTTVRLAGINAPELSTGAKGAKSKAKLADWILEKTGVTVQTTLNHEFEKYGRVLGTFFLKGMNINQQMIDEGYAVVMKG